MVSVVLMQVPGSSVMVSVVLLQVPGSSVMVSVVLLQVPGSSVMVSVVLLQVPGGMQELAGGERLPLLRVSRTDAGIYECVADNSIGDTVAQTVSLQVLCELTAGGIFIVKLIKMDVTTSTYLLFVLLTFHFPAVLIFCFLCVFACLSHFSAFSISPGFRALPLGRRPYFFWYGAMNRVDQNSAIYAQKFRNVYLLRASKKKHLRNANQPRILHLFPNYLLCRHELAKCLKCG